MKAREVGDRPDEFDMLFDIYLKPLKSKSARTIFKILIEEGVARSLTTFDIQSNLEGRGIHLSKKEINGWLHSIQSARLVLKDPERGKPTTICYEDKYTFDLWRLTELGSEIGAKIPHLLKKEPLSLEGSSVEILKRIVRTEMTVRSRSIRRLNELFILVKVLKGLLEAGEELRTAELRGRLMPNDDDLNRILSRYSNPDRGPALIVQSQRGQSLKTKLLRFLGLSSGEEVTYALTRDGRDLAESFLLEGDVGQ